jgi:hypothetical protein|tara:strand:- start:6543 stop:8222 length:1680 start_codon:yes stop_codon:yes gene_type:complete
MASQLLIKRSTGTAAPGTINFGELAVTVGSGTQANLGDRLFIGDNSSAAQVVGGKYYTDMMDQVHGVTTAASALIVDSNKKLDDFYVDDVQINANEVTTSTTDADLILSANGTGKIVLQDGQELEFGTTGDIEFVWNDSDADVQIRRSSGGNAAAALLIQDDIPLKFGTGNDARVYYDETTLDKLRWAGADQEFDSGVQVKFADTTTASNTTTAAVTIAGGLGVNAKAWIKDLNVDDDATIGTAAGDTLSVNSTTTFENGVTFNGTTSINATINQTGEFTIDSLKMDGNVISTTSGTEMIIDPYPAGNDSEGLVIIKGDLQIDGTTTTVNSASMSVNDPTIELGDPTTALSLTAAATSGATVLTVDRVVGLNVGDDITGTGIQGSTSISAIDVGLKQITLDQAINSNIDSGGSIVASRDASDGLDRGVKVHYNDGSSNKFGFFGYDRTGGADGNGAWTFIENATDTNTVFGVTGNRGTVVLGDLELDTDLAVQYGGTGASTFTQYGITYGDSTDPLKVTAAANMASPGTGDDATTSYQVLTVTAAGVPVWTNTLDGGTF